MYKEAIRNRITLYGATVLATAGTVTDAVTHSFVELNYPLRTAVPSIIGEHIGNFGLSTVGTLVVGGLGVALKHRDPSANVDGWDQRACDLLISGAPLAGAIANVLCELEFVSRIALLRENAFDTLYGVTASVIAGYIVHRVDTMIVHTRQARSVSNT